MAERIEFVGNPLPTGLPGFGGGTVSVLVLPGFNTVVAVQQFGPVVDAPTVTPPNPEPPPGSNPENPTPNPVPPAPAPPPPDDAALAGLGRKLDKVPPCNQVKGLFGAFAECGKTFKDFTICEDGEPKTVKIFIEE